MSESFRPHNTMRFDVSMPYFATVFDGEFATKEQAVTAISEAIQNAVEELVGRYIFEKHRQVHRGSEMLHHEQITISFD